MFNTKYPAFAALLAIVVAAALDLVTPNETLVQKLEGSMTIIPQVLGFIPQASQLSSELSTLKSNPADIEAGAEQLVTDLAFSSAKAKAIIAAAFPLADSIVASIPQVSALVTAIKS